MLAAAAPAQAEDQQPVTGRVMQWFGVGGDAGKDQAPPAETPKPPAAAPAPAAAEPAAQPLPEGAYIPGANVLVVGGGPVQSRVLKMMGLTGDDPAENAAAAETSRQKAIASGIAECPDIVVDGSGAELRSPAGADASSVAYQLSITRTARECALAGEEISMRVGVLGAAMLGRWASPATISEICAWRCDARATTSSSARRPIASGRRLRPISRARISRCSSRTSPRLS